ncbi:hypothetical protein WJ968_03810 [Achromobacter xylosoxidans]
MADATRQGGAARQPRHGALQRSSILALPGQQRLLADQAGAQLQVFAFQPLDASGLRGQQPAAMRLHASVGREQGGMLALQLLAFVGRKTHRVPRRLEEGDGPADGMRRGTWAAL